MKLLMNDVKGWCLGSLALIFLLGTSCSSLPNPDRNTASSSEVIFTGSTCAAFVFRFRVVFLFLLSVPSVAQLCSTCITRSLTE